MFRFSIPPQLPINVNCFVLSVWSGFNNFPNPRFQKWQVSSYLFLHSQVTFMDSSILCWGFILSFLLMCYVWLVSTFCSFSFMYILLKMCYFVSAHCCPSFVVYMHSFFLWMVLLSGSKWPFGVVYSLVEYTSFTKVFFILKISVFSLLNKISIKTLHPSFNIRNTGHATFWNTVLLKTLGLWSSNT